MDLRVPTLIKFLNRLKSGTAAGNKIYIKGNRRNNFRILKKVVYLVYYLKAILKRGTLNIQLRMNPNSYCLIMAGGIGNRCTVERALSVKLTNVFPRFSPIIVFLSSPEKNMKISSKDNSRKYRIPIY